MSLCFLLIDKASYFFVVKAFKYLSYESILNNEFSVLNEQRTFFLFALWIL